MAHPQVGIDANDAAMENGDGRQAIVFFIAGRGLQEVAEAAQHLVATVYTALGGWPTEC